jgi:hypothetical protein
MKTLTKKLVDKQHLRCRSFVHQVLALKESQGEESLVGRWQIQEYSSCTWTTRVPTLL